MIPYLYIVKSEQSPFAPRMSARHATIIYHKNYYVHLRIRPIYDRLGDVRDTLSAEICCGFVAARFAVSTVVAGFSIYAILLLRSRGDSPREPVFSRIVHLSLKNSTSFFPFQHQYQYCRLSSTARFKGRCSRPNGSPPEPALKVVLASPRLYLPSVLHNSRRFLSMPCSN